MCVLALSVHVDDFQLALAREASDTEGLHLDPRLLRRWILDVFLTYETCQGGAGASATVVIRRHSDYVWGPSGRLRILQPADTASRERVRVDTQAGYAVASLTRHML